MTPGRGGQGRLSCGKARGISTGEAALRPGGHRPPWRGPYSCRSSSRCKPCPGPGRWTPAVPPGTGSPGVEAQLLADGLQHALAPLSMYVGVLLQMLPLIPSSSWMVRRASRSMSELPREKFRYLQLCMMGGRRSAYGPPPRRTHRGIPRSPAAGCPRTMESSTKRSFLPSMSSGTGICFILATCLRTS